MVSESRQMVYPLPAPCICSLESSKLSGILVVSRLAILIEQVPV